MKHNIQTAPPYSEAQTTAWLAWLARGMQQHGQTIFLIEQLQPSWLSTRRQRWVYILTSRLIWGIVSGLIVVWFGGLDRWLILGLSFGLILGLIGSTMDMAGFSRKRSRSVQNKPATPLQIIGGSLLFGLLGGLLGGLLYGLLGGVLYEVIGRLLFGLNYGSLHGLVWGLSYGLLFGVFWMSRSYGRKSRNEIHTVETIRYSWADVPRRLVYGLVYGLIFGLMVGLVLLLQVFARDQFFLGITFGVILGVIIALMSCFRPGIRELKTTPNQGIRLSLRNGGLMGGLGGLVLGLIMGLLGGWTIGLAYGVLGGLCIGLWYGGLDVIQHYIVRALLVRQGVMPRNYARFLDYAAEELNFLQKVGGGYMFVHRYLLEYFAAMEQPKPGAPADRQNVAQSAGDTV